MNIDDLTYKQIKELLSRFAPQTHNNSAPDVPSDPSHPYHLGQPYFIRTVTMYFTGVLQAVHDQELVLTDCAWIQDTGRFADSLSKGGSFSTIEPFPDGPIIIGRGALIDAGVYGASKVPRTQK